LITALHHFERKQIYGILKQYTFFGKLAGFEMIRLKRILFPTDFSDFSAYAASFAVSFAVDYKAKLYVLHVIEFPLGMPGIYSLSGSSEQIAEKAKEFARAQLKSASPEDVLEKLEFEVHCREGKPFWEIIEFAKENKMDMIVMGTRGRSGLESVLLGSTAEKVLRKSTVPVFVVRRPGHRLIIPPVG